MPVRRLVIVDPSLRGADGHYFDYDREVALAARAAGLQVLIIGGLALGNEAVAWLARDGAVDPGLSIATLDDAPLRGASRRLLLSKAISAVSRVAPDLPPLLRRVTLWRTLTPSAQDAAVMAACWAALIDRHTIGLGDHVLVPTPEASLIEGLLRSLRSRPRPTASGPIFHLVLRRDLDETGPLAPLIRHVEGLLASLAPGEAERLGLRFHADTARLCAQYRQRFPGLEFRELPIPVRAMGIPAMAGDDEVLNIASLGNARREKGFHLLGDVIEALARARANGIKARLVVQTNANVAGGEAGIAATVRRLREAPEGLVRCVEGPLTSPQYAGLMASAAFVLLPYDPALYLGRSSGVFAEALALGKPVIVPDTGWMADGTHPDHGVTFSYPDGLAQAVEAALADYPRLRRGAKTRSAEWQALHNPERLVTALLAE